jgi:hypothetical protein
MKKKEMIAGISKNKTPVRMGITFFKVPALHRGKNCCSKVNPSNFTTKTHLISYVCTKAQWVLGAFPKIRGQVLGQGSRS